MSCQFSVPLAPETREQSAKNSVDRKGDASKINANLGWKPEVTFEELVQIMVDGDIQLLEDERSGRLVRVDR